MIAYIVFIHTLENKAYVRRIRNDNDCVFMRRFGHRSRNGMRGTWISEVGHKIISKRIKAGRYTSDEIRQLAEQNPRW